VMPGLTFIITSPFASRSRCCRTKRRCTRR
jgi:hypothetical protein